MINSFNKYGFLPIMATAVLLFSFSAIASDENATDGISGNQAEQNEYYIPMDFSNGVDTAFEDVNDEKSSEENVIAENSATETDSEQNANIAETGKMAVDAIVEGVDKIASEVSNALADIAPAAGGQDSETGESENNSDDIEIEEYHEEMNDLPSSTEQNHLSP